MKHWNHALNECDFVCRFNEMTVKDALKLNRKVRRKEMLKHINWEKVVAYGVGLGYVASSLYLLTLIAARIV